MRIELDRDGGGFEMVCESAEDWRSLVTLCTHCGSVHCYGPLTWQARIGKAGHGKGPDDFCAVQAGGCSRCTADVRSLPGERLVGSVKAEAFTFA